MKSQPSPKKPEPRKWLSMLGLAAFVLALCGMPVLAYFTWSNPWILLFLTFFYIVTAFVLQSRVISCVLAGVFLGLFLDPVVNSGGPVSQIWETVKCLLFGLFVGAAIGFLWDYGPLPDEEPIRTKPKPHR